MNHRWQYGLFFHKEGSYGRRCEKCGERQKEIIKNERVTYHRITAGIRDSDCSISYIAALGLRWSRWWRNFHEKTKRNL